MRAKEFTEPIAAGCILYAEDTGRWGLQQRSDTVDDPGMWAAWGGGREPGETPEQTARRELAEESGYRGPVTLEPLARNAKYVTFVGIVPHEFEPQPCDEWKDYCWVELGKWPTPMHPGVAAALENVYIKESANDPTQQDLQDVAGWMHTTPEELSIEVRQEPIEKFMRQIREMYGTYDEFPEDEERTNRILKLLKRGAKPLPIYVEANDPDLFVMEGRHRMVAFWLSGMTTIPVAYVSVKGQQDVTEAFNKPYKGKWEKSESGSYDMLAKLPDGTNLSIMFNNEGGGKWQVEFYRNNSQEVTGEGDAQRIFATVLGAIQKFIKKHNPLQITFSASKEVEPGQNAESRAKLYNRLVDRYAAAWGYDTRTFEHGNAVSYELSKYPSDGPFESVFTENFADGGNPVKFTVTSPDGYKHSFQITLAVHGKHVGHFNFVRSADTDDVNNEAEVESRWQGQGYGKLLLLKAIDVANNHGLDFQQDIRGITDAQQNVYDSLENAGLIVTPGDGFWFLTPQGEQELTGLNENFADGKKPGRKGLSRRVGIPKKASLSKLQKIASSSTGERRRMAQWQLNMRRGKAKKK